MQDDYDIDVVFRISEEKKQVKYSRSEARILEVLDNVCSAMPQTLPLDSKKGKKIVNDAVSLTGGFAASLQQFSCARVCNSAWRSSESTRTS